ncbi:MAG: AzlC family ABC transporter permease [Burkholderiales bacterium]|nr:AzlC family ABC transporter permease [Burkholderiales bacterium]
MSPSATRRAEFVAGLVAVAPLAAGSVPFGLIYGVLAVKAGIPAGLAIALAAIVFAGSAQFMITQLVAAGTPGPLVVASVAAINLRHALYSAALAPALAHLNGAWRAALAYLLTDESYAASLARFEGAAAGPHRHWHLLGAGLGLWLVWQLSCIAGVTLGSGIPPGWSLEFAGTLTFIAIVVPLLRARADWAAMTVAGVTAVAAQALPYKLAIIAAAGAGMLAGMAFDRRDPR